MTLTSTETVSFPIFTFFASGTGFTLRHVKNRFSLGPPEGRLTSTINL